MDKMVKIDNLFDSVFQGKKVLITGDTGFKGSWLAIWLNALGAEVYGYALPPLTKQDNYVVCHLENVIHHKDGDIRDKDSFYAYYQEVEPDMAFHLAAQPLVLDSYEDPHYTFETNLMGTVNFFEAVRCSKNTKVAINITSDKCYQNNEWVWGFRESDPLGGKDPYSASKGCSELISASYLQSYFADSAIKIATARAGNVIGAGDWAVNRVVPDFFKALKFGKTLSIRNPHATRPWQHVLEPLSGYLLLASKLYHDKQYAGAWNFGPNDKTNYPVYQLINQMQELTQKVNVEYANKTKRKEANFLKLDISKAVNNLDWRPVLSFKDTIALTVKGYLADLDGKQARKTRLDTLKVFIQKGKEQNINWITNNY